MSTCLVFVRIEQKRFLSNNGAPTISLHKINVYFIGITYRYSLKCVFSQPYPSNGAFYMIELTISVGSSPSYYSVITIPRRYQCFSFYVESVEMLDTKIKKL